MELLEFLIKNRRKLILGTIASGIIGAIFSLVTPKKYEATSCIMPSFDVMAQGLGNIAGNNAAMSMLQLLGGVAATPADIYAELAKNRVVIERLIKQFSLDTVYKTKYHDDLVEAVKGHISTTATLTGLVYISYRDKNPGLAADICNAIINELDRLNREIIVTKGKKLRIFLGERLKETEDSLKVYQDSLAYFQKNYGVFDLETYIKSIITNWEVVEKKYINLKLQYEFALAEMGSGSKTTINLKKRLEVIEREKNRMWNVTFDSIAHLPAIKNIPKIGENYARIKLMLDKYIQTYKLLAAEYEKAKIMEKQNTPTLQIIYKAQVPERRYWPKRKLIVLIFMVVFFLTYTSYLAILHIINKTPGGRKIASIIINALLHPLGKD